MKRSHRNDRGVVAVEAVFVIPALVALIFAIIAYAQVSTLNSQTTSAARDGARALSIGSTLTTVTIPDPSITIKQTAGGCPGPWVEVTATAIYKFSIVPLIPLPDAHLIQTARMPCQAAS
jgi:hypothetical protein